MYGNSLLFTQFFCQPKTAQKNKVYYLYFLKCSGEGWWRLWIEGCICSMTIHRLQCDNNFLARALWITKELSPQYIEWVRRKNVSVSKWYLESVSLEICFLKIKVWNTPPVQMDLKFSDHWPPVTPLFIGSAVCIKRDLCGKLWDITL